MSQRIKRFYEFGPYRIDSVNRILQRSGEPIALKSKVADTLLLFLEQAGEVVGKEELMTRLWPDSFVEEANLTQNIYVLRKAMPEADYIETIPRRGYRFTAPVRAAGRFDIGQGLSMTASIAVISIDLRRRRAAGQTHLWLRARMASHPEDALLHAGKRVRV